MGPADRDGVTRGGGVTDHFSILDGAITPQPWMQHRPVATGQAASVARAYSASGGGNKDDLVQSVLVKWTNNTPGPQWVHGMVTRSGVQVALQARSRGYLADFHGFVISNSATTKPVDADYDGIVEVSRSGAGMDNGRGGMLAIGTGFGIAEKRENSTSAPFMPHSPGLIRVEAGKTIWARVDVRFRSEFWENTSVDGGSSSTQSGFISGDTRVDLYAVPAIVDPGPRPNPTIVGVEHDVAITDDTEVDVPAGTAEGDVIVAVVANQWGALSSLVPVESGWTQLTARDARGNDIHLRVLARLAGADEPDSYNFENAFIAESIVHLITIRNAEPFDVDGWYVASALRQRWWETNDGHIAPTINRGGQLLLTLSYVAHALSQAPITQTPPTGMTEISEVAATASTISIAALAAPPRPTGERTFVPSKKPVWSGHSIAVSLLIPGTKPM